MRRILLTLAAAALLAACGGDNDNGQAQGATQTSMAHGAMSSTTRPAGKATRTVKVSANDQLRFQPASVSVMQGETVAFTVTNTGKLPHEFVIGDQAFQAEHEKEMAGQEMPMADEANGIGLPAGVTKTLTYTFTQPGTLLFACHTAGHYQSGMEGTITVG